MWNQKRRLDNTDSAKRIRAGRFAGYTGIMRRKRQPTLCILQYFTKLCFLSCSDLYSAFVGSVDEPWPLGVDAAATGRDKTDTWAGARGCTISAKSTSDSRLYVPSMLFIIYLKVLWLFRPPRFVNPSVPRQVPRKFKGVQIDRLKPCRHHIVPNLLLDH